MTFEPDQAGLDQVLANSQTYLASLAAEVVDTAISTGPRNARHGRHVIDRLAVGQFRVAGGEAQQDIDWNDGRWHFIEYGSARYAPQRTLTRAAQNHGLNVIDRGPH